MYQVIICIKSYGVLLLRVPALVYFALGVECIDKDHSSLSLFLLLMYPLCVNFHPSSCVWMENNFLSITD
uniref:Ovule protein n=1 Tax=Ditylenchus dipsaci TaxID=166011 RepID=A0A915DZC7_9BILA